MPRPRFEWDKGKRCFRCGADALRWAFTGNRGLVLVDEDGRPHTTCEDDRPKAEKEGDRR